MPKVSIIIPTFNRAEFLRSAIKSVLNQTFQDFEIIVVDDASKDNTREVVDRFHDSRIKYLYHNNNGGEAHARNTGMMNSNGQYIAFLDDDDEWLPDKLRLQVDLLDRSSVKCGLVYTGYVAIDRINEKILLRRFPVKRGEVQEEILVGNFIGAPSTVVLRRECIERVGLFDERITYGLDYDLWIRISEHYHFDYVEDCLVIYNIHENRLSNNPELMARGLDDMVKKYGKNIFKNKSYRNRYFSIGILFCRNGDVKKGIKAFINAIKLNPFEIRNYLFLGCSLFGAKNFERIRNLRNKLRIS
ncbi:MAG: glycosyltransferase [Nitrospirota bacterium]